MDLSAKTTINVDVNLGDCIQSYGGQMVKAVSKGLLCSNTGGYVFEFSLGMRY